VASTYPVKHTYTAGDTDATDRYNLKRNGSAVDLTGYTAVTLYAKARGASAVTPIVGSIVSPSTAGIVEFDHTTIAAMAGAYICQIKWTTAASKVRRSVKFQTDVQVPVETAS
jgi:hypothetical protein